MLGGKCEILVLSNLWVGIGLQEIGLVILGHPIVEPRIPTHAEQSVDALGELAQLGLHALGKLGGLGLLTHAPLVCWIPLSPIRCDQRDIVIPLGHDELPRWETGDAFVAHYANIDLPTVDELL